jgi:subtilisin family serine protease
LDTKQFTEKKFWQMVNGFDDIFKLSPNTLFVIAGGNNGIDNVSNKSLELCIHTPNTLTVGALGRDLKRKDYSNYGKDVEIYAPAHFDLEAYKDSYAESSGTSAASPVACNLAIKLFCLDPKLSPVQVKKLMIDSSDKDLLEEGINVINPKKAVALMRETVM